MIQAIAFYIFATVVIVSAGLTIASRNPVHSVMWLILAFFNAAGLMVLCGAEFIAMLLVIVYVGAVAVLFLFVVMMLDIEVAAMRAGFARYLPLGLALAVALLAEVIIAFQAWSVGGVQLAARAAPIAPEVSNIQAIGNLLYTRYLFIFEGAGLVLLVAITQTLGWCSPVERFAWSAVESVGDEFEVLGAVYRQVGSLREVLAQ